MLQNLTEQELNDLRAAIALDYQAPVSRFRAVTVDPQERLLVVFESDQGDRTERVAALFSEGIQFHPLATLPAPVQIGTVPPPEPPLLFSEFSDGIVLDCDAVFEFGEPIAAIADFLATALDEDDMKAFINHNEGTAADYALPQSVVERLKQVRSQPKEQPPKTDKP